MLSSTIQKRLFNLCEAFCLYLSCHNYSPQTVVSYRNALMLYISYLERNCEKFPTIKQALREERLIETVSMRYRDNSQITAHTIRHYISAYRAWIKYLVKINALPYEFERFRFDLPKLSIILPKTLPEWLLQRLLTLPIRHWIDMRNRCIFELMAFSGLRIGEVLSIRLTDLNLSHRQIKVLGKGNIERIIPISVETAYHIGKYLQTSNHKRKNANNLLFVSNFGRKLSSTTIRLTLQEQAQALGYQERITPHYLRHFCATHFVHKTKDLRFVQQLLGHRNITSTQVYVHLDRDYIHQTFDEYCLKINTNTV